jgi:hypothetical protein
LVVEERKERKRASESKSRKKKVSLKAFVLILNKPNNNVLHLLICMEMDTIDEIGADLIREVKEVQYNFPSPTSLEDGV